MTACATRHAPIGNHSQGEWHLRPPCGRYPGSLQYSDRYQPGDRAQTIGFVGKFDMERTSTGIGINRTEAMPVRKLPRVDGGYDFAAIARSEGPFIEFLRRVESGDRARSGCARARWGFGP